MKINYGRYLPALDRSDVNSIPANITHKRRGDLRKRHICVDSPQGSIFLRVLQSRPSRANVTHRRSVICGITVFKQEPKVHSFELVLTLGGSLESTDNEEFMMPFCFSGYG